MAGGRIDILGTASRKQIAYLGATNSGDGAWILSDKSGRPLMRGDAADAGGILTFNAAEAGKQIAYLGATNGGDGAWLLSDRKAGDH